jgi:hypothetical protein
MHASRKLKTGVLIITKAGGISPRRHGDTEESKNFDTRSKREFLLVDHRSSEL